MKTYQLITKAIILGIFTTQLSIAQNVKLGIKAGLSIPSLRQQEDNIYADDFESITVFEPGIYAEFLINEHFSIQPEIIYAIRGGKREGLQPIPPDQIPPQLSAQLPPENEPYANFSNESNPRYLEIPILFTNAK